MNFPSIDSLELWKLTDEDVGYVKSHQLLEDLDEALYNKQASYGEVFFKI